MKNSIQMLKVGLFAGSALFAMTGTARAEQAPAPATPAADTAAVATNSGEIIVTANRRDQSLQDVPMTLQALSADSLSKLNVTTFSDLLKYTPNVTFGNPGARARARNLHSRIVDRGLAVNGAAGAIGGHFPTSQLYLDDQSMQFPVA